MKNKCFLLSIVLIIALSIGTIPALAIESNTNNYTNDEKLHNVQICQVSERNKHESKYITQIGPSSVKDSLVINGVENYLYPTFDDIDKSLKLLETAIPNYYEMVQKLVDLKILYEESWEKQLQTNVFPNEEIEKINSKTINDANSKTIELTDKQNAILNEEKLFRAFYDIYENKAKNEEIKDYLQNTPNPDEETLAILLPYSCPFAIEYFQSRENNLKSSAQYFNKDNGITYATNYATSVNSRDYGYFIFQGDCTNFASQILVAGGIKMHDMYPDKQNGWWHRRTLDGLGHARHSYSVSWINADRFVKFMGTSGNEYTSFYTFSTKLNRGDFIAFDGEKDGDWNHVGFVTAIGSYGNYSYIDDSNVLRAKYYRNFKVAQHSKDYHAWTSSDTNGWEKLGGSAKFAIVRRNAVA